MGLPQILMIAYMLLSFASRMMQSGAERRAEIRKGVSLTKIVGTFLLLLLLWWGGFFVVLGAWQLLWLAWAGLELTFCLNARFGRWYQLVGTPAEIALLVLGGFFG